MWKNGKEDIDGEDLLFTEAETCHEIFFQNYKFPIV